MGALTVIAIKFLIQAGEFFSQVKRLSIKCVKPRFEGRDSYLYSLIPSLTIRL